MDEWTAIAYSAFGLSSLVSALQIGRWLLNANPRAIITTGRWSLFGLCVLAPLVLLWLILSGRSSLAMMFAAFILPVAVQGAHRWRRLLRRLAPMRVDCAGLSPDPGADAALRRGRSAGAGSDPELVRQSVAVLRAYLEQAGSGQGRRMSVAEALQVLGLDPSAGMSEIWEAHRGLANLVDPQRGGTLYLAGKIDEARDVLLGDCRIATATFDKGGPDHV